jgi:chromosome segregation ATPase
LSDLKTTVEEAVNTKKGGEQPMNEFENQEVVEQVENPQTVAVEEADTFQVEAEVSEPEVEETTEFENNIAEEEATADKPVEQEENFELQTKFDELQASYDELQSSYSNAQSRIEELEQFQSSANEELETLRAQNAQLQASLQNYEAQVVAAENERKENLIKKYEKVLDKEEIATINEKINDFSYDELESKLAITFANSKISNVEEIKKVPLQEQKITEFEAFMSKYQKN